MTTAVSTLLALILCLSAGSKAWRMEQASTALATYGVSQARFQLLLARALVAVELGLGVALMVGAPQAPEAAAGLFLAFAALTSAALFAGRGGRPCACFGSGSRLS